MPNPFRPKPQRPFDPHRFERLRDFLEDNHIDWETYLRSLLVDGRAPAPFIYGPDIYLDRADVSSFRGSSSGRKPAARGRVDRSD